MQAVYDAFVAHQGALEKCSILHGDINDGMDDEFGGRGVLYNFDLCAEDFESSAGYWQFASHAHLLRASPPKPLHHHHHHHHSNTAQVKDDLKSFLYIVLYFALRYTKNTQDEIYDFASSTGKYMLLMKRALHRAALRHHAIVRKEPLTECLSRSETEYGILGDKATRRKLELYDHRTLREAFGVCIEAEGWPECDEARYYLGG
ncbi:hypothetical protein BDZ97DRAFT_1979810 [Flammula alnicola]|nr:hypothetical protein BDZ97DRAFT_1979810 [Flammula alnicola]